MALVAGALSSPSLFAALHFACLRLALAPLLLLGLCGPLCAAAFPVLPSPSLIAVALHPAAAALAPRDTEAQLLLGLAAVRVLQTGRDDLLALVGFVVAWHKLS